MLHYILYTHKFFHSNRGDFESAAFNQLLSTGWNSANYTKTTQSDPPAMEDHPRDTCTARLRAEILLQLPNEAGGVDMWRGVC